MSTTTLGNAAKMLWHIQRIKRSVRNHLGAGMHLVVSVRETACVDQQCEGPATEIKIITLGLQEVMATLIHKPVSQITDRDIAAFANGACAAPTSAGEAAD